MKFKRGDILISKDYPTEVAWRIVGKNHRIKCLRFHENGRYKFGDTSDLQSYEYEQFFIANKFFKRLLGLK